jgi:ribonuclease P/MRP protein subunit POP5
VGVGVRHLPKSLRPRYRYLVVEIETWPDAAFDERDLQRQFWYAAQNLLGDPGSADADLRVLDTEFWRTGGEAIVRVRRDEVEAARAAIACVDTVQEDPVRVGIRGVSGTMRAAEEKYKGGPPEATREESVAFRAADRSAVRTDGRVDVATDGGFVGATPDDIE